MGDHLQASSGPVLVAADVVVDVASLGFAIGSALDGPDARRLVHPHLPALVTALGRRGLQVRSLWVAVPVVPVRVGADANPDRAVGLVAGWERWLHEQTAALDSEFGLDLEVLAGATDGIGEVGVDELVAWTALELADGIGEAGDRGGDAVVVVSSDSDMWHLASLVGPAALVVAGGFRPQQRADLLASGRAFVAFSGPSLEAMAPQSESEPPEIVFRPVAEVVPAGELSGDTPLDGVVVVERLAGGLDFVGSSPRAAVVPIPSSGAGGGGAHHGGSGDDGVEGAHTIAVVDAYGLFRATQMAIGAADLPGPEEVRGLLAQFGWDSPIATLFVVPDLSAKVDGRDLRDEGRRHAWRTRDAELDALAAELDEDGDPLTQVRRSELRVGATSVTHKRLSTGIVAELWRATRRGGGVEVVVLTEDRGVCWLLECAPRVLRSFPPVTRMGLHPSRVEPLAGAVSPEPSAPRQLVVLTEYLAAQLTGVLHRSFGRSLRDRLADAAGTDVRLEVHGIDAESGGLEVTVVASGEANDGERSSMTDGRALGELRTILHSGDGGQLAETLAASVDGLGSTGAVIELYFDHRRTCSAPEVVLRQPDHQQAETREARVVQREGYRLWVDLDFDGIADLGIATGHDTTTYRVDETVVIQRAGSEGDRWVLRDPGPGVGAPEVHPVVLRLQSLGEGGAQAVDVESGRVGWVEPMPGQAAVDGADYLFAVEVPPSDGPGVEWIAVSSALRHLTAMLG